MYRRRAAGLALLAVGYLSAPAVAGPPTLHADLFEVGAPDHCGVPGAATG
jgi:hypothetical protein